MKHTATVGFIVLIGESALLTEWPTQAGGTVSMGYTAGGRMDHGAPQFI